MSFFRPKKKIGEILVEEGKITQLELQAALARQRGEDAGKRLGQILVEGGIISEGDLTDALAKQFGIRFFAEIGDELVDAQLLSKFPMQYLRKNFLFPAVYDGSYVLIMADPTDLLSSDYATSATGIIFERAVASKDVIIDAINRFYPVGTSEEVMEELDEDEGGELELSELEERDIMEMANDAPIVKLVNHVIFQAVKQGASDIHIEPFEKEVRIRYRIDGVMQVKMNPPKRIHAAIVSRVKIMSGLDIAEKRVPQDGRIQLRVAGKPIDIRVSILPCAFGERVVMRLLDKSRGIVPLDKIGMDERDLQIFIKSIERPNGIVLVSGPTGSGKTTTLYSALSHLNDPDSTIITVEDPVEYTIFGISQVQVNLQAGMTFARALRSILRQDPDIILIGEIRDTETAHISIQAALTGHLVLSTIHTNSAPATVTRLVDMGIEPFLISSSLACVVSQRLVRRLCDKCKRKVRPDPSLISRLGVSKSKAQKMWVYEAVGCSECYGTGYKGRLALFEVMEITPAIHKLIASAADASKIRSAAKKEGMRTLAEDGLRHILAGETTIDEVLGAAYGDEEE